MEMEFASVYPKRFFMSYAALMCTNALGSGGSGILCFTGNKLYSVLMLARRYRENSPRDKHSVIFTFSFTFFYRLLRLSTHRIYQREKATCAARAFRLPTNITDCYSILKRRSHLFYMTCLCFQLLQIK